MKRMILIALMVAAGFSLAIANPLPEYNISEYSTSPPWIELSCGTPDTVLGGYVIHTMGGDATINPGVFIPPGGIIVLDSSNTSGFVLSPEGDSIVIEDMYLWLGYGCRGRFAVPPVAGESAEWTHWHNGEMNFSVDTSPGGWAQAPPCNWGQTQVVINEVNAHGAWATDCGFIELFNRSNVPIDISGWQIICDNRHYISSYTTIPARGYYILDEWLFPGGFGLSPGCDNIYLLNASEQLVDQVGWSSDHGENVSFMRFPNGGSDTMNYQHYMGYDDATSVGFSEGYPSRGARNRIESPGLRVIGMRAEIWGDRVNLHWTNPIWLVTFDQAILRKSTTGFPQTPFEGELIFEGREQEYLYDFIPPGQTAYYTVFARTTCGDYSIPDSESQVSVASPVGVYDDGAVPDEIALLECYPNPFNAAVTIRYSLGRSAAALAIYNIAGQRVVTLSEGTISAGEHQATWNASGLPSGVYFARLEAGGQSRTTRLILLK